MGGVWEHKNKDLVIIALIIIITLFVLLPKQNVHGDVKINNTCDNNTNSNDNIMRKYCLSTSYGQPIYHHLRRASCKGNICTFVFDSNVKLVRAEGMSMAPTVCHDDYVILMEVDNPEDLNIGEVVEVVDNGDEFSHRIIDTCNGGFITKGDLDIATPDGCIPYEKIKAVEVGVVRK